MRNATPVLPFKTRRPTRRHYFLRVNFRPFSFFTRTTRAKINPAYRYWAAATRGFIHREPSEQLCRRYMHSTESRESVSRAGDGHGQRCERLVASPTYYVSPLQYPYQR